MSFINLYNRSQDYAYINSIKIGNSIFSIGLISLPTGHVATLLTKFNASGNVLWDKSYHYEKKDIVIKNSQLIECPDGDLMVLGQYELDGTLCLTRINTVNGTIIWQRKTDQKLSANFDTNGINLVSIGNDDYIVALQDHLDRVVVIKFDGNGDIVLKKVFSSTETSLKLYGVTKGMSKIALYGSVLQGSLGYGYLIELDFDLQIIAKFQANNDGNLTNLYYVGESFYAFSFTSSQNGVFISKHTVDYGNTIIQLDLTKYFYSPAKKVKRNGSHFYLEGPLEDATHITKVDYNLTAEWTKRFTHLNTYYLNGILYQVTDEEILIIDGSPTNSSIYSDYAIGKLGLELLSCKTLTEETVFIDDKNDHFDFSDILFDVDDSDIIFGALGTVITHEMTSNKEVVCPTESDFPCVKDEEICEAHAHILEIFNGCLVDPSEILNPKEYNFSIPAGCAETILQTLYDFDKKFPNYHLIAYYFSTQIKFIDTFLSEQNYETYLGAWNAISQIIDFLSNLGNCGCGNAIEIDDNTLLQSPNFYLQSAGSDGGDSTKGIHLRWTFAGVLGENHLPKGNYATTTFNFNKPNDFVRIHRAKYIKKEFALEFTEPPQTINDSQQYWLYKFNNDNRIFFVYFRNQVKYSQARALYNPFTNPAEFFNEYGNELIEIENKRELFFAAKLVVSPTTGASLQLESLSVRDNVVFTPKYLAFRKSYDESELGDVRVVNENGRVIRFRANLCFVKSILFEFYSDFIKESTKNGEWVFKGSYALTTNDALAFSELEPIEDAVNGKWLRFNEDAFVRVSNYQTKWNGTVEPWNRNIKDIVNRYVLLSEAADNPRAMEYLNINLANDTDPISYESEETEEGMMPVSNLDMLRVIAYDYHIARMLGLGTLDLNPNVFEGEYIYLASYTTLGDLGNGPGLFKHLSMALPTSIETQRLPVSVNLDSLVPGFVGSDISEENDFITGNNGYSLDGKKRYISILAENLPENAQNPVFYFESNPIDFSTFTIPVYAGLESRKTLQGEVDDNVWDKPELSHDIEYVNIDLHPESYETIPIFLPDPGETLYVDIHERTGTYYYASYGINWFSRATSSPLELNIYTELKPFNSLLPPSNVRALLIRKENPLLFTSQSEQTLYDLIIDNDKTLIRLSFDYNSDHELITCQIPEDTAMPDDFFITDENSLFPDDFEVIGDEIEIYFRSPAPRTIMGQVNAINNNESLFLSKIETGNYFQVSTGETLVSELPAGTTVDNFVGSIFLMGDQEFVIHTILPGANGLDFMVYKKQLGDGLLDGELPDLDSQNLLAPVLEGDGYFTVVENMQNTMSWGTANNPNSLRIIIGKPDWTIHRELVKTIDSTGNEVKYIEKTRGFWSEATIEKFLENFTFEDPSGNLIPKYHKHRGIYKITFNYLQLGHHQQIDDHVDWFNGTVRLFTNSNYSTGELLDSRKVFTVFRTENIGTSNNLVLYINDDSFMFDEYGEPSPDNDDIIVGNDVEVNYYPSYKAYLFHNDSFNLSEDYILPAEGEGVRYSIFGLKTIDYDYTNADGSYYKSKFSIPALLAAQELIGAETPERPLGGLYATRPDFYGKSTYTFITEFNHKPHGVSFYRADNQGFLSALYSVEKMNEIKAALKEYGGSEEEFFVNRWENFLDFEYLGDTNNGGVYKHYPANIPIEESYNFPLPNKPGFFQEINSFINYHNNRFGVNEPLIQANQFGNLLLTDVIINAVPNQNDDIRLIDFVKEAIMNVFIPLTEVPIIYRYIKTNNIPSNKKQKIRDRDGYLIVPPADVNIGNSEFDMAPMMKIVSSGAVHKAHFTDFTLDGTSDNIYFYAVKELSSQMKMGDFSPVLGPIKLVNSNPPEAPKLKSVLPILENRILGTEPQIGFEIAAYPEVHKIGKINLYRTTSRINVESVQSMDLIKVIDIENSYLPNDAIWAFTDDFNDLLEVPYADGLFYRVTVSRKVEYADSNGDVIVEYAPSQPSKIIVTTIVEAYKPESPVLEYYSEPQESPSVDLNYITLHWHENVYKGNYRLYKLNSQGNWVEIARVLADKADKRKYHLFNTQNPTPTEMWTEYGIIESINGEIYLQLETTNISSHGLTVLSADGSKLFHHFKVIAENTAGMFSVEEKILTLYNEVTWADIGGIAVPDRTQGMIIGPTFRVR